MNFDQNVNKRKTKQNKNIKTYKERKTDAANVNKTTKANRYNTNRHKQIQTNLNKTPAAMLHIASSAKLLTPITSTKTNSNV